VDGHRVLEHVVWDSRVHDVEDAVNSLVAAPVQRMAAPRILRVSASKTTFISPCVSPFSMARLTRLMGRLPIEGHRHARTRQTVIIPSPKYVTEEDRARYSAEGERESLRARVEKLYLETSVGDGLRLSDQLIQTLLSNSSVALLVNVNAVSSARRLSV
jgi:hypothetical protein